MSGKGRGDRHIERYQPEHEKGDHQDRKEGLEWGGGGVGREREWERGCIGIASRRAEMR